MARYAVISDVHGNLWALNAVLDDVRARGVDAIINLGDSVYGPLEPRDTAARLRDPGLPVHHILGNQDRIIFETSADLRNNASLAFTREALDEGDVAWLRSLEPFATVGDVRLCHGTPSSDEVYLLERVSERGVALRDAGEIAALVEGVGARVLLCGHTHVPRVVRSGELTIVNPGSVGLPAFADAMPHPHAIETGSPHARYAVVTVGDSIDVDLISVAYNWGAAALAAERNGRPDWAFALRTGRAS